MTPRDGGAGRDGPVTESLGSLYREVILDHYRRPRNKGDLEGATHSQASASMMTRELEDRSVDEALGLAEKFTRLLRGDEELEGESDLGDLRALSGVARFPVRVKCALLGFNCLEELLDEEESGNGAG